MHGAVCGAKGGLTEEQVRSTATGPADDACWSEEDRLLIRVCDALHRSCDIHDELWLELRNAFSENAIIELLMLAGFYRTVSYLTNGLRLPLEDMGERFPERAAR